MCWQEFLHRHLCTPGECALQVKTVEVTQAAENKLTVRVLQVRGTVEGRQRTMQLTHYHYHAWPDHGAPEESYPIRCMCDALPRHRGGSSKVVVHCSAGIGRTGEWGAAV